MNYSEIFEQRTAWEQCKIEPFCPMLRDCPLGRGCACIILHCSLCGGRRLHCTMRYDHSEISNIAPAIPVNECPSG